MTSTSQQEGRAIHLLTACLNRATNVRSCLKRSSETCGPCMTQLGIIVADLNVLLDALPAPQAAAPPVAFTPESICCRCVTVTHCEHHGRCLAECVPADLLPPTCQPALQVATCETCKFWCAGKSQGEEMRAAYVRNEWDAQCGKAETFRKMLTVYVYGDGRVDDYEFDTPPSFGCALHKPIEVPHE